jgi:hypothetical protein
MIIKVKQGAVDQNSWRFHDGVHEFSYATVERSRIPLLDGVPHNEQMGIQFEGDDDVVRETHFIGAALPEQCLCLCFIDFNGKPHEVYTDAQAYLLNDSGKTIERLS